MANLPETPKRRGLDIFSDMNDLYEGFFRPLRGIQSFNDMMKPAIDIVDEDKRLIITADMPGMDKRDIEVSMDNNILTMKGQKQETRKDNNGDWVRQERSCGQFERRLQLGDGLDEDNIDASYKDGVLTVIVPKLARAQHKTVKIDVH